MKIPLRVIPLRLLTAVLGLCLSVVLSGAQPGTKKVLTLELAKEIAAAAEGEARKNNWNVVIAILDDGGNLVYLQRMDETQIGSIDVAQEKARSAVLFKRPTKAFEDAVAGGRTAIVKLPGAMPVEGGLPIMLEGKVIGGIGVSGVTSQQDGQIGKAALDALPKIISK
ncbi:MAG: GlcG/HbpS family heme-binding protein [Bryobacteraceae bacterium]